MNSNMGIFKRWIRFVELSTKLVSLTPFFIGTAYSLYVNGTINLPVTAILFIAVFFWSLTVTMINNYIDKRREGGEPHFSTGVSLSLIFFTGCASMLMGLWLTWVYGLPVLIAGAICFGIGILYSFGPVSISRTPYGEIASGLTEGFLVIFLAVFVNASTGTMHYADLRFEGHALLVSLDWVNMLCLLLLALPNMCCTSNIMLANNICDVERDAKNKRYTLPYFIGRSNALKLFQILYSIAYLSVVAAVLVGVLHPVSLAALLTAPAVLKNVKKFSLSPIKAETFILAVKNYTLLLYGYCLTILAGWALNLLLV
jgi:1,4-dihydroxy-2-naphthoate polyprenyltransferase